MLQPGAKDQRIRGFDYDSPMMRFARFPLDDLLPVATKGLNIMPQAVWPG